MNVPPTVVALGEHRRNAIGRLRLQLWLCAWIGMLGCAALSRADESSVARLAAATLAAFAAAWASRRNLLRAPGRAPRIGRFVAPAMWTTFRIVRIWTLVCIAAWCAAALPPAARASAFACAAAILALTPPKVLVDVERP